MYLYRHFDLPTISILLIKFLTISNEFSDKFVFSHVNFVFTDKVYKIGGHASHTEWKNFRWGANHMQYAILDALGAA